VFAGDDQRGKTIEIPMNPMSQGDARRKEILIAFGASIIVGPAPALRAADIAALIRRAVTTFVQTRSLPAGSPTELHLRAYARDIIQDAFNRGCIENGTGATAFIVFAFAWCACMMRTHQLTWRGMQGIMASIDDLLCTMWYEAKAPTAFPSTRGRS
jgi:hypothetical protein